MSTNEPQTFGETLADVLPVIGTVFVAGPPLLPAWLATVLFALLLAGPFALLVTLVLVFVAAIALVALAGAILAAPFMLAHHLRAHRAAPATSPAEPQPQRVSVQGVGVAA